MLDCFDQVFLDEWYRIVPRPGFGLSSDWGDDTEFPFLHACLTDVKIDLRTIAFSARSFGAIGGAIPILTVNQFLWLLPHAARALLGHELIGDAAKSFVDGILRLGDTSTESIWSDVRPKLHERTIECLERACRLAVKHGWHDERRQTKRLQSCLKVLGRNKE